ncbi:MAG TPA: hypothetical protein VGQ95_03355, partial [Chthoniobacterales bacterium]|nr:hypothetical protein [Chthoniobacterales bacterium]
MLSELGVFFWVARPSRALLKASRFHGLFGFDKICFGETPKVRAGLALHARRVPYPLTSTLSVG